MELNNIDELLDAYFQGSTNLEEESRLIQYFNSGEVADHLVPYMPIFRALKVSRKETSKRDFYLPQEKNKPSFRQWAYLITAILVIALGIGMFLNFQAQKRADEKEALIAFKTSKEALLFLSEKFNHGAEQLNYVDEFGNAKNKVFEKVESTE